MNPPLLLSPRPLAGRVWPGRAGCWLVLLHGFLADSRDWLGLAPQLTDLASVLALDLPGHGDSREAWPATSAGPQTDWRWQNAAVLATIRAVTRDPVVLLGYSMGGRVAAQIAASLAGKNDYNIRGLILESTHPGLSEASAIAARQQQDERWAIEVLNGGMAEFARQWQKQALFASQQCVPEPALVAQHAVRNSQSAPAIAISLRRFGTGNMPAVGEISRQYKILSMVGSLDSAYVAHQSRWAALAPGSRTVTVAGAGHNVHLEKPEDWLALVREMLVACADGGQNPSLQSH